MADADDPIDRVVDLAFNIPIAGVAFARDLTKFSLHQFATGTRDLVAGIGVRIADDRARAATSSARMPTTGAPARTDRDDVKKHAPATATPETGGSALDIEAAPEVAGLAIEGYDQLNARQIVSMLDELTESELNEIRRYEQAGRGRRTVLAAVGAALAG